MRRNRVRLIVALLSALALAGGLIGTVQAQQRHILIIEVKGIIDPISERFIARAIDRAEADGAELLVIKLDTPGGLLSSTREITQHLLEADVPTVVYVSPRGARAASAGTFITAAANFAVMAPGTNIGAASPVSGTGEDLPDTLKSKATNDAAAEIRSIAAARGRNEEKLEETVLLAVAFTAEEAVELRMVDFVAGDMEDLLAQLHGRETALHPPDGERVVLDTQGVDIRTMEPTLVERFLRFLADPNVSFLLLSLGSLGLLLELLSPGLIVPGVVGAILIILSLVSLGSLPVNWAGVALILLAVGLTVLEFYVAGWGHRQLRAWGVLSVLPHRRAVTYRAVHSGEPVGACVYGARAGGRRRLGAVHHYPVTKGAAGARDGRANRPDGGGDDRPVAQGHGAPAKRAVDGGG